MTDNFSITVTEEPVLTLHLAGRLDSRNHRLLLDAASSAQEAGARYLLIDLQDVEFIASAGLGALQRIFQMFTPVEEVRAWEDEKHGEPYKSPYFKMAAASADVYYVLNLAGFLQNILIYPDMDGALKSFPQ